VIEKRRETRGATLIAWGLVVGLAGACSGTQKAGDEPEAGTPGHEADKGDAADKPVSNVPLGPITKGSQREHPAGKAWVLGDGEPRAIDIGEAEAKGMTVLDLGDGWTPYIFTEKTAGQADEKPNTYRERYLGLASDKMDQWGESLDKGEHNYLELYGIPPTLSVVWNEWQSIATVVEPCLAKEGYDGSVFTRFKGTITYKKTKTNKRKRSAGWFKSELAKKAKKAKIDLSTPEGQAAAATHPKTKAIHKQWRELQDEIDVIANAQRRFKCEGEFGEEGSGKNFQLGVFDAPTTHALAAFERKHDIMGWGHFKNDNIAMLAKSPTEVVHGRLLRVIEERVVSAAGIVEDGSAAKWKKNFVWKDKSGKEQPLRDLVQEFTDAAVRELDLGTPESAHKQLAKWAANKDGFEQLLVAVKLPPLPEYYSADMEFDTVIDRGDIWYDFPYDELGNKKSQPRSRYPHLTLYTTYEGQRIPLVHWRTTIGSWRNEMKDGELMLKYKNSDVGARVWKDIMAAPVWIPPATTPPEELIKGYWRKGKFKRDVNYPEIGPGYRSAYGLVAAYHIREIKDEAGAVTSELDNSIRTHGSVDYMSILRRFSHGCHRLYNMDAVRLFSFVLRHREYTRLGQKPVGVRRDLVVEERTFNMRIDTRGYEYELVRPIPVMVTQGRIKGRRKSPIVDYVPIPNVAPEDGEIIEITDTPMTTTVPPAVPALPPAQ
jgi:hypothetical protein